MQRFALLIAAGLAIAACGQGGTATDPTSNGGAASALAGSWALSIPHFVDPNGFDNVLSPPLTGSLTIAVTGDSLAGTWVSSNGAAGTLAGTFVPPSAVIFTLTQTTPCAGAFAGAGIVSADGRSLNGSYLAASPCVAGSFFFTATKQ